MQCARTSLRISSIPGPGQISKSVSPSCSPVMCTISALSTGKALALTFNLLVFSFSLRLSLFLSLSPFLSHSFPPSLQSGHWAHLEFETRKCVVHACCIDSLHGVRGDSPEQVVLHKNAIRHGFLIWPSLKEWLRAEDLREGERLGKPIHKCMLGPICQYGNDARKQYRLHLFR